MLSFWGNDVSRKILQIGLIGNILRVIDHWIFNHAGAVLFGYGKESVGGIVVKIYVGHSDDGIEASMGFKRIFNAAAGGIPHYVRVGVDVA